MTLKHYFISLRVESTYGSMIAGMRPDWTVSWTKAIGELPNGTFLA